MSRHSGINCDFCKKGSFTGHRYKCLVCYDYDLCSMCYDTGKASLEHSLAHPVQCYLLISDFELYYGGDSMHGMGGGRGDTIMAQSFTCPYCAHVGFTTASLEEHVRGEHAEAINDVICPVCVLEGQPNYVTNNFSTHLRHYHDRSLGSEDDLSFESAVLQQAAGGSRVPAAVLRTITRSRAPAGGGSSSGASGASGGAAEQNNSTTSRLSGATLASLAASSRAESYFSDPLSELLAQMTRHRSADFFRVTDQLHEIETQIMATRRQLEYSRAVLDRSAAPSMTTQNSEFLDMASRGRGRLARQGATTTPGASTSDPARRISANISANLFGMEQGGARLGVTSGQQVGKSKPKEDESSKFLLSSVGKLRVDCDSSDDERQVDHSHFIIDLLTSSLVDPPPSQPSQPPTNHSATATAADAKPTSNVKVATSTTLPHAGRGHPVKPGATKAHVNGSEAVRKGAYPPTVVAGGSGRGAAVRNGVGGVTARTGAAAASAAGARRTAEAAGASADQTAANKAAVRSKTKQRL